MTDFGMARFRGKVAIVSELAASVEQAISDAGRVDALINIAGGSAPGRIGDMDFATWKQPTDFDRERSANPHE
ncbi:MAG: hypothetical protein U1E67_13340 [Hyphomicrobiales bacterium]